MVGRTRILLKLHTVAFTRLAQDKLLNPLRYFSGS